MSHKTIAIFGGSKVPLGSPEYQQAYELGQALGQAGYRIANGGYGGTMEATAKGAREYPCETIGVTCSAFGRKGPNAWITREISTPGLHDRLDTLIQQGDAYAVLPGSTGTLLELAMVWELVNKHFLPPRPIICIGNFWKPVVECVIANGDMDAEQIYFAQNTTEVLAILKQHL